MDYRASLKEKEIIVIKIGTSSLTFPNGRLNLSRIEHFASVINKLREQGKLVVLVSSGAIAVGIGKLGLRERPKDLSGKQAAAAIGQAVLMKIYRKFFDKYGLSVAQILLTYDVIAQKDKNINAKNTFSKLLEIGAIPIVNENDSVATDEIEIGDNDTLSAMVSVLCDADLLILLSDIDGLFDANPKTNPDAKRMSIVEKITPQIEAAAGSAGSNFGTGGMITKITAAKMCTNAGIDIVIANSKEPEVIFDILAGKDIGTLFVAK
ncbi:MAG: glutamate 5-kinase [Bacteroidales bacterium]|nr:glutamate 5-kinase [Bacteroidales bacterium]